jgi:hypothetical protein
MPSNGIRYFLVTAYDAFCPFMTHEHRDLLAIGWYHDLKGLMWYRADGALPGNSMIQRACLIQVAVQQYSSTAAGAVTAAHKYVFGPLLHSALPQHVIPHKLWGLACSQGLFVFRVCLGTSINPKTLYTFTSRCF